MSKPILFYSYAHADERFQKELEKQLILLQRQGVINTWYSHKITLDTKGEQPIDSHLREAELILLLISPDLVASHYWYDIEMAQIMEQYKKGESRVIPIIIRSVDWSSLPFRWLQPLPLDDRPVAEQKNRAQAFQEVAKGIKEVIKEWFSSRTIEEWLDRAEESYKQGRAEDALWCARQALHIDPNHMLANFFKGQILRQQEYFEEALETIDHLLLLSPACIDAYAEKVRILTFKKHYQEALDVCEQASRREPLFAPIYYLKADLLIEDGRYHEALLLCQKSIDLDENDAEAYVVKSMTLAQLHRLEEALEACEQAEKHAFHDPKVEATLLATKAMVLYFLRDLERALETYNELLNIDPLSAVTFALYEKATVLRDLGRYSEMVTTLSPALHWNFKDVQIYKLLVEAFWHLKRFDEAIPLTLEIIRLEPNYVKAYEDLAILFLNAGRLEEALAMCEQAIDLGPTEPTIVCWAMGKALYHFGRYQEALAAYQRVLTYPPNPPLSDWACKEIEKTLLKLNPSE